MFELRAGDCGRWTKQILENEFGAELNVAGVVALRRYQTERGVGRSCRPRIQAHACAKVRMVESIQSFSTNLNAFSFTNVEVLCERQVGNRVRLVTQTVERGRHVANSEARQSY